MHKEISSDEINSQLIQIIVEALNLEHSLTNGFLKISSERSYQKCKIFLASSGSVTEFALVLHLANLS